MDQDFINALFDLNEKAESDRTAIYTAAKIFAETLHRHALDTGALKRLTEDVWAIAKQATK